MQRGVTAISVQKFLTHIHRQTLYQRPSSALKIFFKRMQKKINMSCNLAVKGLLNFCRVLKCSAQEHRSMQHCSMHA